MKNALPLLALLLATACTTANEGFIPEPAQVAAVASPAANPAAEDARLVAFLDSAFDESIASSPQTLTALGTKTNYNRLDDYTDAQADRQRTMSEAQLARMKAQFDYSKLSPAGQLNYRLFEYNITRGREQYRWRDYGFPMSTNGSPAGAFPVFLINQHRVDNVADAEAYIARIARRSGRCAR
jgi:uncharacterized protein (DUF885 family)